MKAIINTFKNGFKVSFAESANVFIYFLSKLPLIGKRIPEGLYGKMDVKQMIGIIVQILIVIGGFVKAAAYLGFMIVLPAYLIVENGRPVMTVFFHILFFLSFLAGPLMKSTFLNKFNKRGYKMVVLMRVDAREYYLGEFLYKSILGFIYLFIPMMFAGMFLGFSTVIALVLSIEIIAARLMGEWILVKVYDRWRVSLIDNNLYGFGMAFVMLAAAYALPAFQMEFKMQVILDNVLFFTAMLVTGTAALVMLCRYKGYHSLAKTVLSKDNVMKLGSLQKDMRFGDVKLNEKKIGKIELQEGRNLNKEGYAYLNHLFFRRHRRMLMDPTFKKTAFIGAVFLAGMVSVLFFPEARKGLIEQLPRSTPLLVFVMYFMSNGEKICRAMFHNCDVSLLRYAYYREAGVILSNFIVRLKHVVLINLIPAAALSMSLLVLSVAGGMGQGIVEMIPVVICVLCLACFFSIHHLFMYYVIQPYTAELTVKSPFFFIANFIVYIVSYGSLQVKTTSQLFAVGVIVATIIYMVIALLLTFRLAPRNFRLK